MEVDDERSVARVVVKRKLLPQLLVALVIELTLQMVVSFGVHLFEFLQETFESSRMF